MSPRTYAQSEHLRLPYTPASFSDPGRFANALGVNCTASWSLARAIRNDLDANALGVRWWSPLTRMPERALIADQLFLVAKAIPKNLVEAHLHQLEADEAWLEVESRYLEARPVRSVLDFADRQPNAAIDELPDALLELHMAGFFRAVGSALDCLGGAIVGVLGLRSPLLRSDYGSALRVLDAFAASATEFGQIAARFLQTLRSNEAQAGPTGWLTWAIQMRNMLVHRGRRLHVYAPTVEPLNVLSPRGLPMVKVRPRWFLPRSPGLSEVEEMAIADGPAALTLRIRHRDAMAQVKTAVIKFVHEITTSLLGIWELRRSRPELQAQPLAQWPQFPSGRSPGFGSVGEDLRTGGIISAPELEIRIRAAALEDGRRQGVWQPLLREQPRPERRRGPEST